MFLSETVEEPIRQVDSDKIAQRVHCIAERPSTDSQAPPSVWRIVEILGEEREVRRKLERSLEDRGRRIELLATLSEMLEKGRITQQEFDELKDELFGRLPANKDKKSKLLRAAAGGTNSGGER